MSGRLLRVRECGRTIVVTGYRAADLCRAAGLKPLWNGVSRGYVLDAHRLPDVLARAEHEGRPVTITTESEVTR